MAEELKAYKLEIEIYKGHWVEVSHDVFRSWTGKRKLNGSIYTGDVFYLYSDKIAVKE